VARILAFACGGWWTLFGVGSALSEGTDLAGFLVHASVPGLILLATAVIAWPLEAFGGVLLMLEGIAVFIAYPIVTSSGSSIIAVLLIYITMALPPLVAGILFLVSWVRMRRAKGLPMPREES